MSVRARDAGRTNLTPVLNAVTNDWEPGRTIAQRAGIDPKTGGPRLAALAREGKVEFMHDQDLDARVYRLARDLPSTVAVAVVDEVRVAVTETSWQPLVALSFDEWHEAGRQLQRLARSVNWLLGDWIAWGEHSYGEAYTQAIEETGLEQQTLLNVASVARRVDPERRRESLSWSHHAEVASLKPAEQDRWLEEAETEGYSVKRLRSRLAGVAKDAPDPDSQLQPDAQGDERAMSEVKDVILRLSRDEARALWHAAGTTVLLMDEVGEIPKDAPLYGQRDRLAAVARRIDHEINCEPLPACGRLLVGRGGDTWDPTCTRDAGHGGTCSAGGSA